MFEKEYQKMYEIEKDYWWFVGKRRIIRAILEPIFLNKNRREFRILDIGCGCGLGTLNLTHFGRVLGLDISDKALRFCQGRGLSQLVCARATLLPLKNNTFDLLVASDLLEHLENDIVALEEFYRVLKPKGLILLTAPAHPYLYSEHDVALRHKRRYEKDSFKWKVKKSDFSIQRLTYFNSFLSPIAFFIRRFKKNKKDFNVKSDFFIKLPFILNQLFLFILIIESFLIRRFNLSFGLSLILLGRKNQKVICIT